MVGWVSRIHDSYGFVCAIFGASHERSIPANYTLLMRLWSHHTYKYTKIIDSVMLPQNKIISVLRDGEHRKRERGKNGTVLFFCVFCHLVKHIFVLQSIIIIIIDTDHYFYILVCAVCACVVQVNIFRYFCLWFIVIKRAYQETNNSHTHHYHQLFIV